MNALAAVLNARPARAQSPPPAALEPRAGLFRRLFPADEKSFRLGEILVAEGLLGDKELRDALAGQRASGRKLGEELVASGRVSAEAVDHALAVQRQLMAAALATAVAVGSPAMISPAEAAQTATRSINFTIVVPPMVRLEVLRQPDRLQVSEEDAARGYVEVPAAALLKVQSNTAWQVDFRSRSDLIRGARVSGLQGDVVIGPAGASLPALAAARHATNFELSYRFDLAPGVKAGTYPWPVAVSAHVI
jgi:hypothetical protein